MGCKDERIKELARDLDYWIGQYDRVCAERGEARAEVKRLTAELARYSKLPPLADGEEYASVGWWRGLDDAERKRWEWRFAAPDRWRTRMDGRPTPLGDQIIVVRERPAPESPAVAVKARYLRAGMVEAETGRVVAAVCPWLFDSVSSEPLSWRIVWAQGPACIRHPDALYSITAESLPDGWQPSGGES